MTSSITQSVATPIPSVVRLAGLHAGHRVAAADSVAAAAVDSDLTDQCSPPRARSAGKRHRCLSNREVTDRCIATHASHSSGNPEAGRFRAE